MRYWNLWLAAAAIGLACSAVVAQDNPPRGEPRPTDGFVIFTGAPERALGGAASAPGAVPTRPAAGEWEVRRGPRPKVKVTHLGVVSSPAPEVLASQLRLPKDTALVVDFVEPNSPAAVAGIKKNDVLVKFDDQLLINVQQFAVLIRIHKPGDEVKLTLIREGSPTVAPVKLVEKEIEQPPFFNVWDLRPPGAGAPGYGSPYGPFGGVPNTVRLQGGPGEPRPGGPGGTAIRILPENLVEMVEKEGVFTTLLAGSITIADGEHTLTVSQKDGARHLLAADKNGKVLFDGPIATPEQKQAVPKDILKKLEMLDVRLGPATRPAHDPKK